MEALEPSFLSSLPLRSSALVSPGLCSVTVSHNSEGIVTEWCAL